MTNEPVLHHVAVECSDESSADRFFIQLLGLTKVKSTVLSKELSEAIFGIPTHPQMITYENATMRCEVFIHSTKHSASYHHLGIQVDGKDDFLSRCKTQGLSPFFVEKEGRQLLFVKDFSGNLYEIKGD